MWMSALPTKRDAGDVFGIKAANTDVTSGQVNHEGLQGRGKAAG